MGLAETPGLADQRGLVAGGLRGTAFLRQQLCCPSPASPSVLCSAWALSGPRGHTPAPHSCRSVAESRLAPGSPVSLHPAMLLCPLLAWPGLILVEETELVGTRWSPSHCKRPTSSPACVDPVPSRACSPLASAPSPPAPAPQTSFCRPLCTPWARLLSVCSPGPCPLGCTCPRTPCQSRPPRRCLIAALPPGSAPPWLQAVLVSGRLPGLPPTGPNVVVIRCSCLPELRPLLSHPARPSSVTSLGVFPAPSSSAFPARTPRPPSFIH